MVPEIWSVTENFMSFWTVFCPFTPLTTWKIKFKKKWKKMPGDIILHKCTKNHDHMLYFSWDMVCDRWNCYFSFWAIFCPLISLTAQKMNILKKWKKCLEILFYICVPKIMIRWCMVPGISSTMDGQMGSWTDGWTDRRTDGWLDRQADGWLDKQTDGQLDGRKM